jgi:hypothetical protein
LKIGKLGMKWRKGVGVYFRKPFFAQRSYNSFEGIKLEFAWGSEDPGRTNK